MTTPAVQISRGPVAPIGAVIATSSARPRLTHTVQLGVRKLLLSGVSFAGGSTVGISVGMTSRPALVGNRLIWLYDNNSQFISAQVSVLDDVDPTNPRVRRPAAAFNDATASPALGMAVTPQLHVSNAAGINSFFSNPGTGVISQSSSRNVDGGLDGLVPTNLQTALTMTLIDAAAAQQTANLAHAVAIDSVGGATHGIWYTAGFPTGAYAQDVSAWGTMSRVKAITDNLGVERFFIMGNDAAKGVFYEIAAAANKAFANWTKRDLSAVFPGANVVWDLDYNADQDLWTAIGTGGRIATSPDRIAWTARVPTGTAFAGDFKTIKTVTINSGATPSVKTNVTLVGDSNGGLARATDGVTFARVQADTGTAYDREHLVHVRYPVSDAASCAANGFFLAADVNGNTKVSKDLGVTWSANFTVGAGTLVFPSILFSTGYSAAACSAAGASIRICADGVAWTTGHTQDNRGGDLVVLSRSRGELLRLGGGQGSSAGSTGGKGGGTLGNGSNASTSNAPSSGEGGTGASVNAGATLVTPPTGAGGNVGTTASDAAAGAARQFNTLPPGGLNVKIPGCGGSQKAGAGSMFGTGGSTIAGVGTPGYGYGSGASQGGANGGGAGSGEGCWRYAIDVQAGEVIDVLAPFFPNVATVSGKGPPQPAFFTIEQVMA